MFWGENGWTTENLKTDILPIYDQVSKKKTLLKSKYIFALFNL
jgi:hypothetical protein